MGQQVKQILEKSFPGIQADLDDSPAGRLHGTVIWDGFDGHDHGERQQMIRQVLRGALGAQFQRIGILFAYTAREMRVMQEA